MPVLTHHGDFLIIYPTPHRVLIKPELLSTFERVATGCDFRVLEVEYNQSGFEAPRGLDLRRPHESISVYFECYPRYSRRSREFLCFCWKIRGNRIEDSVEGWVRPVKLIKGFFC